LLPSCSNDALRQRGDAVIIITTRVEHRSIGLFSRDLLDAIETAF
jgi:hypothetical protein